MMTEIVILIPFPSLPGNGYPDHLGLVLASSPPVLRGYLPPGALNPGALNRAEDATKGAGNLLGE
jgi:hypothetical protein